MKTSLLISTYNWPDALELILLSVLQQNVLPDEVVIADDGSGRETAALLEKYEKQFPVPLQHVWHEDRGFRASEIRNKAIARCSGEYIIQIDGDTVLHSSFVQDHKNLAEQNCFISGSRVLVGKEATGRAIQGKSIKFSPFSKNIINRMNAVHLPFFNRFSAPKRTPVEKLIWKIRGCNMSFWRKDLLEVNGYDADFVGWGREDSELVFRLLKKGCYLKRIKMAAIQYHLDHKENSRSQLSANHLLMERSMSEGGYVARNGIVKA